MVKHLMSKRYTTFHDIPKQTEILDNTNNTYKKRACYMQDNATFRLRNNFVLNHGLRRMNAIFVFDQYRLMFDEL